MVSWTTIVCEISFFHHIVCVCHVLSMLFVVFCSVCIHSTSTTSKVLWFLHSLLSMDLLAGLEPYAFFQLFVLLFSHPFSTF